MRKFDSRVTVCHRPATLEDYRRIYKIDKKTQAEAERILKKIDVLSPRDPAAKCPHPKTRKAKILEQ